MEQKGIKLAAKNSKAYHDYFIEDRFEAGNAPAGTQGKSNPQGKLKL